jgi:hypothetical protein
MLLINNDGIKNEKNWNPLQNIYNKRIYEV